MINPAIPPLIDDMKARLHTHYGVKPTTLTQQLKTIGRDMPRRYRNLARVLANAEGMMGNPKLSRQLQLEPVQKAHEELLPYLKTVSLADRRKGTAIDIFARIGLNLLIVGILVVAVLYWRGLV